MPGSSVSSCHLCHMHSHSPDSLVRTSPLRHSRGRSKNSSKYPSHRKHHHGHSNGGYNSSHRGDESVRVHRCNSASAIARLTDHAHSLPGSRSNSLTRFHHEVSVLPNGGDIYGREMRTSSSTRSLDINPPLVTLLEPRTTTLPRVSTSIHSHSQIHPQPDLLVSAMPRSRTNSRSGSLQRAPISLGQDNSHDYYLHMHRQRFKEEKRKHRFNLQTVMLIGCYTLLVMVAIIVGVVVCYQNGWLGLGPSQGKVSGEKMSIEEKSNIVEQDSKDMQNRHKLHDANNINDVNSDVRTRLRNNEINNLNFKTFSEGNRGLLNSPSLFPTNIGEASDRSQDSITNIGNNQPTRNINNNQPTRNINNNQPTRNINANSANSETSQVEGKVHRQNKMLETTVANSDNIRANVNPQNIEVKSENGNNLLNVNHNVNFRQPSLLPKHNANIMQGILIDKIFVPGVDQIVNVRVNQKPTGNSNQHGSIFTGNNRNVQINREGQRDTLIIPNANQNVRQGVLQNITPGITNNNQDQLINANNLNHQVNPSVQGVQVLNPRHSQNNALLNQSHTILIIQGSVPGNNNIQSSVADNNNIQGSVPGNNNIQVFVPGNNNIQRSVPGNNNIQGFVPGNSNIQLFVPGNNNIQRPVPENNNLQGSVAVNNNLQGSVSGKNNIQRQNEGNTAGILNIKAPQNLLFLGSNQAPNPQISTFVGQISPQTNQRTGVLLNTQINSTFNNETPNPFILNRILTPPNHSNAQLNPLATPPNNSVLPKLTQHNQNPIPSGSSLNPTSNHPSNQQMNKFVEQNNSPIDQRIGIPINGQISTFTGQNNQPINQGIGFSPNPNQSSPKINTFVGHINLPTNHRIGIPLNTQINPAFTNQTPNPLILNRNLTPPNPFINQINPVAAQGNLHLSITTPNTNLRTFNPTNDQTNSIINTRDPNQFKIKLHNNDDNILLAQGNVQSNTIAKALHPGGIVLNSLEQPRNNPNSFISGHDKNGDTNIDKQLSAGIIIPSLLSNSSESITGDELQNPVLLKNSNSLTTQELLDLLAIRRMRDLLNSKGNTQNILELLKNVEPSEDSRLAVIREEKLSVPDLKSDLTEATNPKRGSGRSIEGSIKADNNNFKIRELIQALNAQTKEHVNPINFETLEEFSKPTREISSNKNSHNADDVSSKFSNLSTETSSATISNLVNNTVSGAIIHLLNQRLNNGENNDDTDSIPKINLKGISVVPLNSHDLRILLEADQLNSHGNTQDTDAERLENLQILQRLIELSNERQMIERQSSRQHITDNSQSEFLKAPVTRESVPSSFVSRSGVRSQNKVTQNPNPTRNENTRRNGSSSATNSNVDSKVEKTVNPITNGDATANKRRRPTARSQAQIVSSRKENANQGLSVMIRNDQLLSNSTKPITTFPPSFKSRQTESSSDRDAAESIKERVTVQPGRARAKSPVIRAWTHMDSTGTLSEGRVHSDGSFTFTNCRPAEVCKEPKKDA